jgi:transcriptional regulator with XRE-family HTH domain
MADLLAREIGSRVRHQRLTGQKTQTVIAGLAGITTDYLYQIEQGKRLPAMPVLIALARALRVPPASLIGDPAEPAAGPAARPAIGNRLYRAMMMPPAPSQEPLPVPDLRARVSRAWRLWQTSPTRYSQVSGMLCGLITDTETALGAAVLGDGRCAYRVAADLYGLTRTVAKRTGRTDLALLAADRAYRCAEASADPLRIGAARWNMAHASLAGRDHEAAEDIAMAAADALREHSGPDAAAVHGSLILVASVAAARRGEVWTARDRLRSVAPLAWKTGERNTLWMAFGPVNLAMHAVSIEVEAGEASQACHLAEDIRPEMSPSIERRVAFLLELARSFQQRADYGSALALLRAAERQAPEDVAYRPVARDILRVVAQRAGRSTASEAADMASRLSASVT